MCYTVSYDVANISAEGPLGVAEGLQILEKTVKSLIMLLARQGLTPLDAARRRRINKA